MMRSARYFFVLTSLAAMLGVLLWITTAFRPAVRPPDPYTFDYPSYFGNMIYVPSDNQTTVAGVSLGRRLFYETTLSANNSLSCGSCHRQEFAFTDGKRFSNGIDGSSTKRNSMALINLLWVDNFFWDGRAKGLEEQAHFPITDAHEMGQSMDAAVNKLQRMDPYPELFLQAFGSSKITGQNIRKALAQFERTLISANSTYDQFLAGKYQPDSSQMRGMQLFFTVPQPQKQVRGAACGHCHGGPKTFSELYHNTGLDSMPADAGRADITGQASDNGRFRVVTLRNIALTAPYMHDGRFETLEQVLDHYSDHIAATPRLSPFLQNLSNTPTGNKLQLTSSEKKDVINFLHMLTDSTFVHDKRFSNPFATAKK